MDYLEILNLSKNNKLNGIYVFINRENYLYDNTINQIVKDNINSDLMMFNYDFIREDDMNYDKIYNSIVTLPIMSDKKIVIVENIDQLDLQSKNLEEIIKVSKENEANIIIFTFKNKKSKELKAITKHGTSVEFKKIDDMSFRKWVIKKFKENGKKISNQAINFFVESSMYNDRFQNINLYQVDNEIKKIASLSSDVIEIEDISKVMNLPLEMNIFSITDKLAKKDIKESLIKLDEIIKRGHKEYEIFPLLTKQYNNMLISKVLNHRGSSEENIREILGFKSSYAVKMILNRINKFDKKKLLKLLKLCLDFESDAKSKNVNIRTHLELLFLKLIEI